MTGDKIVIVGNGPAGTRAAETLCRAGCRDVTVISEAPASGGQIYRRQPPGFSRDARALYGDDGDKASRLHATFDALAGDIALRSETLVWNILDRRIYTHGPDGIEILPFDRLILATGAMDRILPIPGWTLPGVFTLGGAQIALKHQCCAIGRAVVFVGTGPLLYLVAYQYAKAGANVVAVLDSARFADKARALPLLALAPRLLLRGLVYRRYLTRRGVPIHEGARPLAAMGDDSVAGLRFRDAAGEERVLICDAIGLGFGLNPELQLAELAGGRTIFDTNRRQWLLEHDGEGRAADRVYVAGDGVAIGGADVAELAGERAALALLSDLGEPVDRSHLDEIGKKLSRLAAFRAGLDRAFAYPAGWISEQPDETILCRCENVTFGEVRATIRRHSPQEVNRLKALARPGMGRCQGRVCGAVLAELLAATSGRPLATVGRLRGQAPIKPLPYTAASDQAATAIDDWMTTDEVEPVP
ncbi:MAG: NAD(P)/FAD-dependent oxidoreductase [Proteobacteria bacterium]|nr:NAD(P)/FAD-dependent oxidoreductase [Pseudomonadota bacterium]